MNHYKYLAKNIGILTISRFATKFISFFLLPLYTGILTTAEYGTYDLYNTTIYLLYPIFTLCITDSVIRFLLDDKYDKKDIISISFKYVGISIVLFMATFMLNVFINIVPPINEYKTMFILMYLTIVLNSWFSAVARGLEKVKDISIAGIISSFVSIILNILFLTFFRWGILGYFLATIIGINVANIYYAIRTKALSYVSISNIDRNTDKELRTYGSGLILNSVSWWINSSLDKYIVLYMCGVAANGLISVAYKLPTVLSMIQNIFEQAWILSAVKEYDKNDSNNFFINTYNLYSFIMIFITSLIIIINKYLSIFLFKKDFYEAWVLVPFFLMAVVFSAGAGYCGGVFAAEKKVQLTSITTLIGAFVNTILNLSLIYFLGIIGAAIATMISNFAVWAIRVYFLKKEMVFRISLIREMSAYFIIILQTIISFKLQSMMMFIIQLILFTLLMILYRNEIEMIFHKILRG